MPHDLFFLPWLEVFCFVALVFVSVYAAMRSFGVTWKAFLKKMALSFIIITVSKFVYAQAEHFGLTWVWFSNKWVFHILFGVVFGLVLGFIYLGARRFGFRLSFFEKD
ncbi:hypothetical protein [Bartonella sp. TT67HLJMS]|uniref:hypothetical protein n=1 Tax=Bartonella sp. TT67HLJMS TaxID=3243582 RepID=UPI0035CF608A